MGGRSETGVTELSLIAAAGSTYMCAPRLSAIASTTYLQRASSLAALTCCWWACTRLFVRSAVLGGRRPSAWVTLIRQALLIIITGHYLTATQSRIQSFAVAQKLLQATPTRSAAVPGSKFIPYRLTSRPPPRVKLQFLERCPERSIKYRQLARYPILIPTVVPQERSRTTDRQQHPH